jgi:hypothetical protein
MGPLQPFGELVAVVAIHSCFVYFVCLVGSLVVSNFILHGAIRSR